MPEFYIIIARKIFFPNFRGACAPPPAPRLLRLWLLDCTAVDNTVDEINFHLVHCCAIQKQPHQFLTKCGPRSGHIWIEWNPPRYIPIFQPTYCQCTWTASDKPGLGFKPNRLTRERSCSPTTASAVINCHVGKCPFAQTYRLSDQQQQEANTAACLTRVRFGLWPDKIRLYGRPFTTPTTDALREN